MRKILGSGVAALAFTLAGASTAAAQDIVDTAVSAGTFNTLVAAVQAAGLVDVLKSEGPWTVFAPTDEAFAALPEGTVESLLEPENLDQLVAILTYHVDDRRLTSNMLPHEPIHVRPVNTDALLTITKGMNGVSVDNANVIQADIHVDNGVIHVIDAVLIPN